MRQYVARWQCWQVLQIIRVAVRMWRRRRLLGEGTSQQMLGGRKTARESMGERTQAPVYGTMHLDAAMAQVFPDHFRTKSVVLPSLKTVWNTLPYYDSDGTRRRCKRRFDGQPVH